METMIPVLAVLGAVLLIYVLIYNSLVARRNQVENAQGSIEAQLRKRFELIPNLVHAVKNYMQHESSVLEKIVQARGAALSGRIEPDQMMELDRESSRAVGSILVSAEAYPALKASDNFLQLQRALNEVEEQLSASRRAYNASVMALNNAVESFPSNLVAGAHGFSRKPMYEAGEEAKAPLNVGKLF